MRKIYNLYNNINNIINPKDNIFNNNYYKFSTNKITLGNDVVNTSIERYKFTNLSTKFINRVFTTNEQLIIQQALNPTIATWLVWAGKEAAFKALQKQDLNLVFSHRKFEVLFDLAAFNAQFKLNNSNINKSNINKKLAIEQLNNIEKHINNNNIDLFKLPGTIRYQEQNQKKHLQAIWTISDFLIHCIAILDKDPKYSENYSENYSKNNLKDDYKNMFDKIKSKIFTINSINYATESLETKMHAKSYLIYNGFDENIEILRSKIVINGRSRYTPPVLSLNHNIVNNVEISISHDHGWGAFAYLQIN